MHCPRRFLVGLARRCSMTHPCRTKTTRHGGHALLGGAGQHSAGRPFCGVPRPVQRVHQAAAQRVRRPELPLIQMLFAFSVSRNRSAAVCPVTWTARRMAPHGPPPHGPPRAACHAALSPVATACSFETSSFRNLFSFLIAPAITTHEAVPQPFYLAPCLLVKIL